MTRTRALAVLLALPLVTVLAAPALATTPADVADDLRRDRVYVDPDVRGAVDEQTIREEIEQAGLDVFVAVLPPAAASANGGRLGVNGAIGSRLGDDAVLITVIGRELTGGAGCGVGLDEGEADRLVRQGAGNVDSAILSAIDRLEDRTDGGRLAGGCGGGDGVGGTGLVALGVVGLGLAGGAGYLVVRGRRTAARRYEEDRADVESLYDRLASEVSTLSPGEDPVAQQALADASERYAATGAAMADADTPGEWAAARRTAVEGLTAARTVRARLGLDPGPEIPPPPGVVQGPQLQERSRVRVGEDEHEGTPAYEPGHPHHFGGGTVGGHPVPGGWYPSRFWEGLLLGGLLGGGSGGSGGGFSGGSFDDDRDRQDRDRQDRGRHDGGGSGDWGGSGGSSGGDWGGSGRSSGGSGSNNSW